MRRVSVDVTGGFTDEAVPEVHHVPDQRPVAPDALRAITMLGALQVSVLAIMLLRSKVLALLLEPDGVGLISTFDQLVQFVAQVSALGIVTTPTRFIAKAAADSLEEVSAAYSRLVTVLVLSTCTGTAIAVGMLFAEWPVVGVFHDYRSVAVIAVLSAPLLALSGFLSNVAAATKGYATTSLYLLGTAVLSLAAAVIGIGTAGIAGLYYCNLLFGLVGVLAVGAHLHTTVPLRFRTRRSPSREERQRPREIVSYCGTIYLLSFAQPLAFLVVRSLMLQQLGSADAGYFQAAFAISSIASLVLMQAIRVHLDPAVNIAASEREKMAVTDTFQRTFTVLILVGTLPLVLFPRDLVAALFTPAFTPASTVVLVLALSECLFLCSQVYAIVLMAVDDFRGFFQAHLAGYACLCICAWFFGGHFGLAGIAWSFLIARTLLFVWVLGRLAASHRLLMTARTASIVAYAVAALAVAALIFGAGPVGASGTLLRLLAFGVVSLGGLAFFTADERRSLSLTWRRLA